LTDEQISALNAQVDEFRAGDHITREKIVRAFLRNFEDACPRGIKFHDIAVVTVRASAATSGNSHVFGSLFGSTFMAQSNQELKNPHPQPEIRLKKKGAHKIYSLNTAMKDAILL
jgi:hypothetical protein